MSGDLKSALAVAERKAIAPLRRVMAARPKSHIHTRYVSWKVRKHEVETHAAKELAAIGATCSWSGKSASIQLAGITARSGRGLLGALLNWRERANAQLTKEKSRVRS